MIGMFAEMMLPIFLILIFVGVYFLAVAIPLWLGWRTFQRLYEHKFTKAGMWGSAFVVFTCWQLSVPIDWQSVFGVLVGLGLLADVWKLLRSHGWLNLGRTATVPEWEPQVEILPPLLPSPSWDGVVTLLIEGKRLQHAKGSRCTRTRSC